MPRFRKSVPSYLFHSQSGRARVAVAEHLGRPKQLMLPGGFNSAESLAEYERILALLRTNNGKLPPPSSGTDLSVNELVLAFTEQKIEVDYVHADGSPTREQECMRHAFRPLLRLFGSTSAASFGAPELKVVQKAMASGSWLTEQEVSSRRNKRKPIGWCRKQVNTHISRVRSLFKWAVSEKMVAATQLVELQAVSPIKFGRGGVRESKPVMPVPIEVVEKSLPHLPPMVADMVLVQLYTGARPGEIARLRPCDIDCSGEVWVFRPQNHKTAHHGFVRQIAVGPKARAILDPRLNQTPPETCVFSPRQGDVERKLALRAMRKTPVQPSQIDRGKPMAVKKPGEFYENQAYARAIARACKKAGVPHRHPHQLRHTAALLIEREQGAEAARATLGHRTLNMTLHYAGIDLRRAAEVAAKMG
jgi:integrase